MKKLVIYLATVLITANCAFSQKINANKNHSIGIIYYDPVYLTGTDKFFNDNWILYEKQNRTSSKYAFGLDLKYSLSKNISLKIWGGVSERSITESSFTNGELYIDTQRVEYGLNQNVNYDQTSINICGGINYSKHFGNFRINSGFELSYLHTGTGNQSYNGLLTPYNNDIYSADINETVSFSSGNSYGMGFFLGAEFNVLNNFTIGAEFHQFLYYSVFDNSSDMNRNASYTVLGLNYLSEYNKATPENFKQFSFSSILPVFVIRYEY